MYDIKVYPDSYIIYNKKYGYNYCRLNFLDVADTLTDKDKCEIVTRMAAAFKSYMEERVKKALKTFEELMDYEKHVDDVIAAHLGEPLDMGVEHMTKLAAMSCKCIVCIWSGTVGECKPGADGDLRCPACLALVDVDCDTPVHTAQQIEERHHHAA